MGNTDVVTQVATARAPRGAVCGANSEGMRSAARGDRAGGEGGPVCAGGALRRPDGGNLQQRQRSGDRLGGHAVGCRAPPESARDGQYVQTSRATSAVAEAATAGPEKPAALPDLNLCLR